MLSLTFFFFFQRMRSLGTASARQCLPAANLQAATSISRFCNQEILPLARTRIGRYLLAVAEQGDTVCSWEVLVGCSQGIRFGTYCETVYPRDRNQKILKLRDRILNFSCKKLNSWRGFYVHFHNSREQCENGHTSGGFNVVYTKWEICKLFRRDIPHQRWCVQLLFGYCN